MDCFPRLSYTAEEANERATLKTDLQNYLEQAKAQFITGEIDVEEGWDDFVNTVNGMGLERLIEIEQAAYGPLSGRWRRPRRKENSYKSALRENEARQGAWIFGKAMSHHGATAKGKAGAAGAISTIPGSIGRGS